MSGPLTSAETELLACAYQAAQRVLREEPSSGVPTPSTIDLRVQIIRLCEEVLTPDEVRSLAALAKLPLADADPPSGDDDTDPGSGVRTRSR
jgi:hypothetical protein